MMQIHVGDCREVLRTLPDCSVDSVVTDPPYELTSARPGGRSEATRGAVMGGFMGMKWDGTGVAFDSEMWRQVLRVLKPGAHLLAFGGSRTYHRMACAIEDAGFDIRDQIMWIYGSGFPKSKNLDGDWQGWGTALKPAHEPIVMARKPLTGTVAANVLQHGTGALNIDAGRISGGEGGERNGEKSADRRYTKNGSTNFSAIPGPRGGDVKGRWPANIIHDGSNEVVALFPRDAGAAAPVRGTEASAASNGDVTGERARVPGVFHGDVGSAARFFYCAKAGREDRDEGLEGLSLKPAGIKNESGRGFSEGDPYAQVLRKNTHPTVKPLDLMRYLCKLVTPRGGVILDPFMGSGSTGRAALLEQFQFIGIELNPEYADIARRRIGATVPPLFAEA